VLHVDPSPEYGGRDASLSLPALGAFVAQPPAALHISALSNPVPLPPHLLPRTRDFALSLAPCVVPATGPLIDALVRSGVARYGAFKLLDAVGMYRGTTPNGSGSGDDDGNDKGDVATIPASKEDVFKSKALSLVEKRRLMKFLQFAAGDFEPSGALLHAPFAAFLSAPDVGLSAPLARAVAYALAHCAQESGACVDLLCFLLD
jgi:RAB protein geranylgeranyltransferase component A